MLPGQGFKQGKLISFMAIPMPIPELYQKALKSCATQCKSLRQDYDEAVRELEAAEKTIRKAIGIKETRPEFLSLSALSMFSTAL